VWDSRCDDHRKRRRGLKLKSGLVQYINPTLSKPSKMPHLVPRRGECYAAKSKTNMLDLSDQNLSGCLTPDSTQRRFTLPVLSIMLHIQNPSSPRPFYGRPFLPPNTKQEKNLYTTRNLHQFLSTQNHSWEPPGSKWSQTNPQFFSYCFFFFAYVFSLLFLFQYILGVKL